MRRVRGSTALGEPGRAEFLPGPALFVNLEVQTS